MITQQSPQEPSEDIMEKASFIEALLPILVLVGILYLNVSIFDDTLSGANQMALMIAAFVAVGISIRRGMSWDSLQNGIVHSIGSAMPAILILLMIGALSGTWLLSGIVPAMIYYGLKILNPAVFLVAACIVSAVVSLATGSSWSTIATIGIALLAIGKALGFHDGLIAGAIISGAYFGDKMSPLSDTTNLAPAMAGTDIFTHIRYMLYTTVPSIVLTLIIFLVLGIFRDDSTQVQDVSAVLLALESAFYISPLLFIVPIIVVVLIVKKVPALPALFLGALLGGILAIVTQNEVVVKVAGGADKGLITWYIGVMKAMFGPIELTSGDASVDKLLSSKGMAGMLNTIWLIVCSMVFGGVMETSGLLRKITMVTFEKLTRTPASLVATTAGTCVFLNATASDQYLAIVVPGRMFAQTYRDRGLAPENLSRTLEDAGTVTSVLIPWNTCGATQAGVLQVDTLVYWPFCFFNWISPIMSILFAVLKIKIKKLTDIK